MNRITEKLLDLVADWSSTLHSAYSIRENGTCVSRHSTENISIESMESKPGMVIRVSPGTVGETVSIPACVTRGGVDDVVYNDFYIGADANVTIIAGCGVHTDNEEEARHNGIHRFFLEPGAQVLYKEKHIGTGSGLGQKKIDPVTEITMAEDSILKMETVQIGGVDRTFRKTSGSLAARAKLVIQESILTEGQETAETDFTVSLDGEDSGVDIISRSVAKDSSHQTYHSYIKGNCKCTGHSECDAILVGNGTVNASPALFAGDVDASLIHEAAIGKIAGEQIIKLRTLGLTEQEAEAKIIEGFLMGASQ